MELNVIIERQYRTEAEKHDEIREFDTSHQDHFLMVAEAIIDGRDLDTIAENLEREGWKAEEAVSFVNSVQEDMKFIIDELGRGSAHGAIVDDLIEDDWVPASAVDVVNRLDDLIATTRDSMEREAKLVQFGAKRRATAEIGFSVLFLLIGLSYSLLSTAEAEGQMVIVAYVAVLLGLVGLVAGLFRLTSAYQR